MSDDQQGPVVPVQRQLQLLDRRQIEVISRLVEDEQICPGMQQASFRAERVEQRSLRLKVFLAWLISPIRADGPSELRPELSEIRPRELFAGSLLVTRGAPALRAGAEHGQVADVRLEAVLSLKRAHQRSDRGRIKLSDPVAATAHQMDVLRVGRQVIPVRPMSEMRVRDQADLLKQLKSPVDGRDIDPDGDLLDLGVDLLWRRVLQLGDRFEHELTLRGYPVAASPQRVIPRLRHKLESNNPLAWPRGSDVAFWLMRERRWSNSMHRCRTREVAVS